MNINELVYDLKEHLDTYCQTYDDYILTYNQTEMIYYLINDLQQENQELKKQLEEKENQQKEFVEYLESEIKRLENTEFYIESIQKAAIKTHKQNLSKYKEITGKDINVSNKN